MVKLRQTSKMITKTFLQWHQMQMKTSSYLDVRLFRLSQMHLCPPSSLQSQHGQFSVNISSNFTEWFYSTCDIDSGSLMMLHCLISWGTFLSFFPPCQAWGYPIEKRLDVSSEDQTLQSNIIFSFTQLFGFRTVLKLNFYILVMPQKVHDSENNSKC